MALRKVLIEGDPALRKKCRAVSRFDDRLAQTVADMFETMRAEEGLGLAAPQVGVLRRYFVMDQMDEDGAINPDAGRVFINPEITEREGEQRGPEGCLSLPGLVGTVTRPHRVTVTALDLAGEPFTATYEGLAARCVCHEIDHLDGILYRDVAEGALRPVTATSDDETEDEADD